MLLAPESDLKDLLGTDIPDADGPVRSSLGVATQILSQYLRTPLAETKGRQDIFRLSLGPKDTTLRLSQGLVSTVTEVIAARGLVDALDEPDALDLTNKASWDPDRGFVTLLQDDFRGSGLSPLSGGGSALYVRVTYDAGVLFDEGNPPIALNAPEWLRHAALMHAHLNLASQGHWLITNMQGDGGGGSVNDIRTRLNLLVQSYSRYAPHALFPVR